MRKIIIFLVLISASFLNAAPTCNASNITQLKSCANSISNNGTIYITNDITNISWIDLPIVIKKGFVSIKGSNPNHRAIISTTNLIRRLFDIRSKRKISFENLSLSAYVGIAEYSGVSRKNHTKKLEFTNVKIHQTGPIAGYTALSYNYASGTFNTEFTMIDSEVIGYNALEIKRAKSANILNSSIEGGISGIKFIDSDDITMIDTNASAVAGGASLGILTAPININSAKNVNILGGVIQGHSTVGSRAIIVGDDTKNVYMQDTCVSGGYFNVGISANGSHSFDVKNSVFINYTYNFDYPTYSGIWYKTNTKVNINNSCFYKGIFRNKPLPEYRNNLVTNDLTGNYWEDHGDGQESIYDNGTSLSKCPPTNTCTYQPPEPQIVSEHRFDGCGLSDGSIDIDSNDTTYNGTLDKMVATDPIFAERKVCNAMTFYDDGKGTIQIPNVYNLLNQSASLAFWIRTTQIGGTETWNSPGIFGQEILGTSRDIFWGWINQNGKIGVSTGNDVTSVSNTSINDGYWHHVVLTRDASYNRYKIYIDGVLEKSGQMEDSGASTPSLQGVDYSSLGKIERGISSGGVTTDVDDGVSRYFYGSLDELKIYKGILSNSQVQDIYNNENAGYSHDGSKRTCGCDELNQCYNNDFVSNENETWEPISNSNQVSGNSFIDYTPQIINEKLSITKQEPQIRAGISINGNIPSDNIILTQFTHFAYGGNNAVGTALVLSNAVIEPQLGGYISSLGYAHSEDLASNAPTDPTPIRNAGYVNGFAGGWLGIGLDEHGNYSSNSYKRLQGGPSLNTPNAIAVRGKTTDDISTSTNYLKGTSTLDPQINTSSSGRDYRFAMQNHTKMLSISRVVNGKWQRVANYDVTQSGNIPSNLRVSFTATTGGWNQNHQIDNLNFKAKQCGTLGKEKNKPKNYKFDSWDTFRDINDRNISTKIVSKNFSLTLASLNEKGDNYQDFNGSVCVQLMDDENMSISPWQKWLAKDKNITSLSFNVQKANKDVKAYIVWKKNVNESCPISNETNSTFSTDNFAIRPNQFFIDAPSTIKAGESFNMDFYAYNQSNNPAVDYNETAGDSFLVTYEDTNSSICKTGIFDGNISHSLVFENGFKSFNTHYNEVGIVDINISDLELECGLVYANVDCKDKNIPNKFDNNITTRIGNNQKNITFTLDHFDINSSLSNFENGDFTYLSNEIKQMYAPLDINISAKNQLGEITENYNSKCYAKSSALEIQYNTLSPYPTNSLSTMVLYENNTSQDINESINTNISVSLPKDIYDIGVAPLSFNINFDRDYSKPVNPLNLTIKDVKNVDLDGITSNTPLLDGNATFFYGRVKAPDVITVQESITNYINYEIYDTTSSYPWLQNSLHWYRNAWHTKSSQGSTSDIIDTTIGGTIGASSAQTHIKNVVFNTIDKGVQVLNFALNNPTNPMDLSLHIKTNPWLWYTDAKMPKPYNNIGSCLEHPCSNIYYSKTSGELQSGEFKGSDVNITQDVNTSNRKGVKVFR